MVQEPICHVQNIARWTSTDMSYTLAFLLRRQSRRQACMSLHYERVQQAMQGLLGAASSSHDQQ